MGMNPIEKLKSEIVKANLQRRGAASGLCGAGITQGFGPAPVGFAARFGTVPTGSQATQKPFVNTISPARKKVKCTVIEQKRLN